MDRRRTRLASEVTQIGYSLLNRKGLVASLVITSTYCPHTSHIERAKAAQTLIVVRSQRVFLHVQQYNTISSTAPQKVSLSHTISFIYCRVFRNPTSQRGQQAHQAADPLLRIAGQSHPQRDSKWGALSMPSRTWPS